MCVHGAPILVHAQDKLRQGMANAEKKEEYLKEIFMKRPTAAVRELQTVIYNARGRRAQQSHRVVKRPIIVLRPLERLHTKGKTIPCSLVVERQGETWLLPPQETADGVIGSTDAFIAGLASALCMDHSVRSAMLWATGVEIVAGKATSLDPLRQPYKKWRMGRSQS